MIRESNTRECPKCGGELHFAPAQVEWGEVYVAWRCTECSFSGEDIFFYSHSLNEDRQLIEQEVEE